ncbi:MAG: prepilin-type N-terminal cleavage/methylation domain-containing protein [Gammaproteobacteria bacterium]
MLSSNFYFLNRYKNKGFTLVEILVAVVIFAIGMISVSKYTGNTLTLASDNNARAMALNIATQQIEPLYLAAATSAATFKTSLSTFTGGLEVSGNDARDIYTISINQAIDSSPTPINLLTDNNPTTWVSPLTLGISISYTGRNGTSTVNTSLTFITP